MNSDIVGRGWAFPPQITEKGQMKLVGDFDEIREAIEIILSTAQGERVMRPAFGSRLHELVFAPITVETMAMARQFVEDALTMWEPRIDIVDIHVHAPFPQDPAYRSAPGCLSIEIQYEIKATGDQRSLVYPFYLIPGE
jgi:phage baseplate assembly protein W